MQFNKPFPKTLSNIKVDSSGLPSTPKNDSLLSSKSGYKFSFCPIDQKLIENTNNFKELLIQRCDSIFDGSQLDIFIDCLLTHYKISFQKLFLLNDKMASEISVLLFCSISF
jgi:hypothetical protein